ncbi:uncharacterized protein LOC128237434 [Mya arenaria]|uniref:uncharacterized protein LOC128237434 n=1 Tax=Mya arenaria TaxID=6604 RepID=UPI0022E90420|nr:uncharacterized protein LOC128237434 [Mya arenaria]XP_052808931.1 uncharacterized protein LOC128237434 [Mya arenaria]
MSTVLLMSDTWQPTVLRIVPFSSNNARSHDPRRMTGKNPSASRGFPVLAVTRPPNSNLGSANSDMRSDVKSVNSLRSDVFPESDTVSVYSDAHQSGCSSNTSRTNNLESPFKRTKKFKKKVPEIHSEMKEALKFSVQDINDQLSSSSSFVSSENKDEQEKVARVDNTRTKLPKPSFPSSDARTFCSPVNGVRRSVPLTPGEMELQRIRDSNYVEQVQKKKKFKLNVNQLPRSTTPINDHDPDKLNMKQVIAFLQTKTSKDIQKRILNDKKGLPYGESRSSSTLSRKDSGVSVKELSSQVPNVVYAKDNVKGLPRCNSELKAIDQQEKNVDDNRRASGCASSMSIKSAPNMLHDGKTTDKAMKAKSVVSVRSFRDRTRAKRNERQRPMKEFKLYRFLAIAPDENHPGLTTTVTESVPSYEKSIRFNEVRSKTVESPRKSVPFRKPRETGTAHVLHRHVLNRATLTPPKVEVKEITPEPSPRAIRLPIMTESGRNTPEQEEAPENEDETWSTTSATYNSTKNEERLAMPKKGKAIAFDDKVEVNNVSNDEPEITSAVINGYESQNEFPVRTYKHPTFPRVNISGPKHIHISVPQESKKSYSQEIVRLTLRQDKNATRVTSYMSDIQQADLDTYSEVDNGNESDQHWVKHGETSEQEQRWVRHGEPNPQERAEWVEHTRQNLHAVTNNNFIKVRRKLKTNMYNNE